MVPAIPTVEAYYISLENDDNSKKSKLQAAKNAASILCNQWLNRTPVVGAARTVIALKRLSEEGHIKVICSEKELANYENPNGNAWITDDRTPGQRQYYIRHPKLKNRNLLIEAKDFRSYIEEEQKTELLDFIFSHCSPKNIVIDRGEEKAAGSKVNGIIESIDAEAGIDFKNKQGNYYSYQNPNGAPRKQPRGNYLWLEPSLMKSIEALTPGASLTQSYERDFTFGLKAREAQTLGLSLEGHKKYLYKIKIDC